MKRKIEEMKRKVLNFSAKWNIDAFYRKQKF